MNTDNDPQPLPISALQHWAYCPRQCGLIHLEQAFDDNLHTLRGNALHAKVDQPGTERLKGRRVARALPLWHDLLNLVGKADTVEFGPDGAPYPVEYKNGPRHKAAAIAACDDLQVAAQAMCLETMTGHAVPQGAIFYGESARRRVVDITDSLRQQVHAATQGVRAMLESGRLPAPLSGDLASQRCKGCSLKDRCLRELAQSSALAQLRKRLYDPDA